MTLVAIGALRVSNIQLSFMDCLSIYFRLLLTEKVGGVCRDDTVEGLRFFPNLFLTKTS